MNTAADDFYNQEFAHCPRSPEYKAGALVALRIRAGGDIATGSETPYTIGTAADDAYRSGIQAGYDAWSMHTTTSQK